jgi:energy-converting hydrogenase Eha subunit A
MKAIGILIMVIALVIAVVPQFTTCESQGRMLTLDNGRQIPMKCSWTAQSELALSLPIFFVGGSFFGSKRRETRIALASLGLVTGLAAVLLPTYLIGVCANPDMICNSIMKPVLLLSGGTLMVLSVVALVSLLAKREDPVPA